MKVKKIVIEKIDEGYTVKDSHFGEAVVFTTKQEVVDRVNWLSED